MSQLSLIKALQQLSDENNAISSCFSKKQQQLLDNFARQTKIISVIKKGNGFSYLVVNYSALDNYLKQQQPLQESDLIENIPKRSQNIALYKNSKQNNSAHDVYYLLIKAIGNNIVWHNNFSEINVSEQTCLQGLSSLMIEELDNWQTDSVIFLVENQALFNRLDWLPANFSGSVIYYGGYINQVLLNWLAYKKRATELILFADYDGVGLNNFLRLCRVLKNKYLCHFYLMPNWQEKLNKFGNLNIWQDNQTLFYNAVQGLKEINALTDELNELINSMQILGKGLEQEAIWL